MSKTAKYSIIQFEVKKRLKISLNEYVLLNSVFYLSQNDVKYCYASRNYFSDLLDISRQSVINLIDKLIKRGFLEMQAETRHLRCTQLWIDFAYLDNDELLKKIEPESDSKETLPSVQILTSSKESLHPPCKESLHYNNNIDNNILDNNIYASSLKSSQQEPIVRKFQTNKNNEFFELKETLYNEYKRLYPNVDIDTELNKIEAWLISNPTRRKTKNGFTKFLNNWFSNQQNRGSNANNQRNINEISDYEKRRKFNISDVERSIAERKQSSAFSSIFSQPD